MRFAPVLRYLPLLTYSLTHKSKVFQKDVGSHACDPTGHKLNSSRIPLSCLRRKNSKPTKSEPVPSCSYKTSTVLQPIPPRSPRLPPPPTIHPIVSLHPKARVSAPSPLLSTSTRTPWCCTTDVRMYVRDPIVFHDA
jgi:hypothetical protein